MEPLTMTDVIETMTAADAAYDAADAAHTAAVEAAHERRLIDAAYDADAAYEAADASYAKAYAAIAARAEVGPLYRMGRGQYTFRTYDRDRDAWREGASQPYAAARRARADAIALRVLTGQGMDYEDAWREVYA
jgi:hypothetical protein